MSNDNLSASLVSRRSFTRAALLALLFGSGLACGEDSHPNGDEEPPWVYYDRMESENNYATLTVSSVGPAGAGFRIFSQSPAGITYVEGVLAEGEVETLRAVTQSRKIHSIIGELDPKSNLQPPSAYFSLRTAEPISEPNLAVSGQVRLPVAEPVTAEAFAVFDAIILAHPGKVIPQK